MTTVARANGTRTSKLLLAAQAANVTFVRDGRRRGLAALSVVDRDVDKLVDAARTVNRTRDASSAAVDGVRVRSQSSVGVAE